MCVSLQPFSMCVCLCVGYTFLATDELRSGFVELSLKSSGQSTGSCVRQQKQSSGTESDCQYSPRLRY